MNSRMAECIYCGAETNLRLNEMPLCSACSKDLDEGHKPPYNRDPVSPKSQISTPKVTLTKGGP